MLLRDLRGREWIVAEMPVLSVRRPSAGSRARGGRRGVLALVRDGDRGSRPVEVAVGMLGAPGLGSAEPWAGGSGMDLRRLPPSFPAACGRALSWAGLVGRNRHAVDGFALAASCVRLSETGESGREAAGTGLCLWECEAVAVCLSPRAVERCRSAASGNRPLVGLPEEMLPGAQDALAACVRAFEAGDPERTCRALLEMRSGDLGRDAERDALETYALSGVDPDLDPEERAALHAAARERDAARSRTPKSGRS